MDMLEALARAAYRGLTIGHEARAVAIVGSQLAPDRRHMHRLAANVVIWCMSPPQRVFSQERKESQARVCAATRVWVSDSAAQLLATQRDNVVRERIERWLQLMQVS